MLLGTCSAVFASSVVAFLVYSFVTFGLDDVVELGTFQGFWTLKLAGSVLKT